MVKERFSRIAVVSCSTIPLARLFSEVFHRKNTLLNLILAVSNRGDF